MEAKIKDQAKCNLEKGSTALLLLMVQKCGGYQLRLVVYPIIYNRFDTSQVVVWDFWTINSRFYYLLLLLVKLVSQWVQQTGSTSTPNWLWKKTLHGCLEKWWKTWLLVCWIIWGTYSGQREIPPEINSSSLQNDAWKTRLSSWVPVTF